MIEFEINEIFVNFYKFNIIYECKGEFKIDK